MLVAVHSASAAVQRSLERMLQLGGHESAPAENAALVLRDHLHPSPEALPPGLPVLAIGNGTCQTQDCLAVPVTIAALLQGIARMQTPPLMLGGGWQLDLTSRALRGPTPKPLSLTEKECALLTQIIAHNSGINREELLANVWGMQVGVETHTLETHLYRLRSKLAGLKPPAGEFISQDGHVRWISA